MTRQEAVAISRECEKMMIQKDDLESRTKNHLLIERLNRKHQGCGFWFAITFNWGPERMIEDGITDQLIKDYNEQAHLYFVMAYRSNLL